MLGKALPNGTFLEGFPPPLTSLIPSAQHPAQRTQAVGSALPYCLRTPGAPRCCRGVPGTACPLPGGKIIPAISASAPPASSCHKNVMTMPPQKHLLETHSPKMDAVRAIILMYLVFQRDKEETLLALSVSERVVNTPGNRYTDAE